MNEDDTRHPTPQVLKPKTREVFLYDFRKHAVIYPGHEEKVLSLIDEIRLQTLEEAISDAQSCVHSIQVIMKLTERINRVKGP